MSNKTNETCAHGKACYRIMRVIDPRSGDRDFGLLCNLCPSEIKNDDAYERGKVRGYNIAKGYKEDSDGNILPK